MKDVPSHMMKFMRKMTKKAMNEVVEDEPFQENYRKEVTSKQNPQKVKKTKSKIKEKTKKHIPEDTTPEEKNRLMQERIPRMRERSHKKEIHISKK